MDLKLVRFMWRETGVYSRLLVPGSNNQVAVTLEHSYFEATGGWRPKLPDGVYTCVRGMHRLEGMTKDFETFEITGVPGHTGILFHVGNYNQDSNGCVLLGAALAEDMITQSKVTFQKFMQLQDGVDSFTLEVS